MTIGKIGGQAPLIVGTKRQPATLTDSDAVTVGNGQNLTKIAKKDLEKAGIELTPENIDLRIAQYEKANEGRFASLNDLIPGDMLKSAGPPAKAPTARPPPGTPAQAAAQAVNAASARRAEADAQGPKLTEALDAMTANFKAQGTNLSEGQIAVRDRQYGNAKSTADAMTPGPAKDKLLASAEAMLKAGADKTGYATHEMLMFRLNEVPANKEAITKLLDDNKQLAQDPTYRALEAKIGRTSAPVPPKPGPVLMKEEITTANAISTLNDVTAGKTTLDKAHKLQLKQAFERLAQSNPEQITTKLQLQLEPHIGVAASRQLMRDAVAAQAEAAVARQAAEPAPAPAPPAHRRGVSASEQRAADAAAEAIQAPIRAARVAAAEAAAQAEAATKAAKAQSSAREAVVGKASSGTASQKLRTDWVAEMKTLLRDADSKGALQGPEFDKLSPSTKLLIQEMRELTQKMYPDKKA